MTLIGLALVVLAGVTLYPSLRDWLGLEPEPAEFGDESALSASIVESSESLPPRGSGEAEPAIEAPEVLPETPLQEDATPAPEATPVEPTPTPTQPAIASVDPPQAAAGPFVPAPPTRLVIPAINLDAPVDVAGWSVVTVSNGQQISMWDVPNRFAAGWLKTTAKVGERGNIVLDGHHNIDGEVFRDLVNLKQGDSLTLWAGDQPREYVVSLMKILPEKGQPIAVRIENAKWIQPTQDERVTLITCWPYTNNTHRLIVVALPADAAAADRGVE